MTTTDGRIVFSRIKNPPPGAPVPPILPPQDSFLFLDRTQFRASFAADVSVDAAAFMADSQVPWGLEALNGAVSEPAWKSKPSWYLVSTEDRMIPPEAQRAMSKRAGSTVTEVEGSHAGADRSHVHGEGDNAQAQDPSGDDGLFHESGLHEVSLLSRGNGGCPRMHRPRKQLSAASLLWLPHELPVAGHVPLDHERRRVAFRIEVEGEAVGPRKRGLGVRNEPYLDPPSPFR